MVFAGLKTNVMKEVRKLISEDKFDIGKGQNLKTPYFPDARAF